MSTSEDSRSTASASSSTTIKTPTGSEFNGDGDSSAHPNNLDLVPESACPLRRVFERGEGPAEKMSALEALTGVPIPRQVNLCERLVTEITLKPGKSDRVTVSLIPDPDRHKFGPGIQAFSESVSNFVELPAVMGRAADALDPSWNALSDRWSDDGLWNGKPADDIMSVVIEGPRRPKLGLVDLRAVPQFAQRTGASVLLKIPKGHTLRPNKVWHQSGTGRSKEQDAPGTPSAAELQSDAEPMLERFQAQVEQWKRELVEELEEITDSCSGVYTDAAVFEWKEAKSHGREKMVREKWKRAASDVEVMESTRYFDKESLRTYLEVGANAANNGLMSWGKYFRMRFLPRVGLGMNCYYQIGFNRYYRCALQIICST